MASLFCCDSIKPYRPQVLSHEPKFVQFMNWTKSTTDVAPPTGSVDLVELSPEFAVQLVRQVNFGPLESKRYFVRTEGEKFTEVSESNLIQANFQKLNACVTFPQCSCGAFFDQALSIACVTIQLQELQV